MPTTELVRASIIPRLLVAILCLTSAAAAQTVEPPAIGAGTAEEDVLALVPYLGSWISDEKSSPDGDRRFRFLYDLAFFDKAKTIVELEIRQSVNDGAETLLWRGYKGWDPVAAETYYYGFSPLGRVSRGTIAVVDGDLVTAYSGFDSTGQSVEVVDVFGPVSNGSFSNTSYLRTAPNAEWRVIARDVWRRAQ